MGHTDTVSGKNSNLETVERRPSAGAAVPSGADAGKEFSLTYVLSAIVLASCE